MLSFADRSPARDDTLFLPSPPWLPDAPLSASPRPILLVCFSSDPHALGLALFFCRAAIRSATLIGLSPVDMVVWYGNLPYSREK